MRKHLIATLLLMTGLPLAGGFAAYANAEPQQQGQAVSVITGTVLDENNEPVIGASVSQKGTKGNAAATDAFGNFKLRVPAGAMLEISYVGYKTESVTAANGMTVYLQPTTEMLNELVAIGYGSQKRANLTGAVATVDVARTMEARPQQDVLKALQGAVPGLTVLNNTGNVTGAPVVQIRGVGSLSATQSPLYVVDGVAMDDIRYLNPEEIKEISVLKDASSSAIYGSRAAFGVILITTKGGQKVDRVKIQYTNNFGFSQAATLPGIWGSVEQFEASNEAAKMLGADQGEFFGIYYTEILPYARKWREQNSGPITKYQEARQYVDENNIGDYYLSANGTGYIPYADYDINKIYLNNATPSNQHTVSVNGSTGKATFNASFGYAKQQSLVNFNPDKVTRYNAKVDLTIDQFNWLQYGVRFNYSKRDVETRNVGSNIWGTIWRFPGTFQQLGYRYDEEGVAYNFNNEIAYLMGATPIPVINNYTRLQGWAKATLAKGLTLNADYTYAIFENNCSYAYLPFKRWYNWGRTLAAPTYAVTPASATSTKDNTFTTRWTFNAYATYDLTVAKDHNFKLMLGANAEANRSSYFMARTKQPLDINLPAMNLYTGDLVAPSSSDSHWATAGFFGRFNYDWKGIWLLEYNGRYDGSSKFPAHDQWGFFQSGSAGYRFSEEEYFKPLKSVWNNGKIRASFGEIGNENIGNNMFISTISTQNINYLNTATGILYNTATTPTTVSSSLTWERIRTADVGLDFGFFNNTLTGSFDWFQRAPTDMRAPGQTLPAVLGASAPKGNQGSLRSRGWELALSWNHSFGDWDVYATFSLADSKTKVTQWENSTLSLTSNYSGMEYGAIWGLETDRYFTKDDFQQDANGNLIKDAAGNFILNEDIPNQDLLEQGSFHFSPGDIKFKDLNGDGVINGGNATMIELNGNYYVEGDAGYAAALANPDHTTVAVGSVHNHGDIKKIGNNLPRYEYAFHLGGAWKGIDLDIYCQGVGKRDMWTVSSMVIPFTQAANDIYYKGMESHNSVIYDENWNAIDYVVDQNNKYPRLYPGLYGTNNVPGLALNGNGNYTPQTKYLQDISYLRIKNITLGYTLPANLTSKAYIERLRIYFSGENLGFIHRGNKGTGFDPEIVTTEWSGANTVGRANPIQRTYSFGLQVTF
ncbi:MAG: TonB-dependent receptor [Muribaculaceae bacterium]|nr:TonB-dependent receptor [Muribaculaceae bacterium]